MTILLRYTLKMSDEYNLKVGVTIENFRNIDTFGDKEGI